MAVRATAVRAAPALLIAASLAACGAGEQLSPADASRLQVTLNEVAARNESGDCTGATSSALGLRRQIRGLDRDVDEDVRQTLRSSAAHLAGLVREKCAQPPPPPTISEPESEPTQPSETTPTEPPVDSGEEQQDYERDAQAEQDKARKERQKQLEEAQRQRDKLQREQELRRDQGSRGGSGRGEEDE